MAIELLVDGTANAVAARGDPLDETAGHAVHDAPHHKYVQEDLFAVAAMLKRAPQDVPRTSSIPLSDKEIRHLEVTVTLKPGSKVQPKFPFEHLQSELAADESLAWLGEPIRRFVCSPLRPDGRNRAGPRGV